jgi:outer membrane protein assembly factor BamD (BamD/ComL family)
MRLFHFLTPLMLGLLLFGSCVSGADIAADLSPEELIQRGQDAMDRNRYAQALQFYQAVLDRFPTNIDALCAAEYEMAFIHYKQKKYDLAKTEFNALLARYDTPDEELLPPQFKRLAQIVLERIAERE